MKHLLITAFICIDPHNEDWETIKVCRYCTKPESEFNQPCVSTKTYEEQKKVRSARIKAYKEKKEENVKKAIEKREFAERHRQFARQILLKSKA